MRIDGLFQSQIINLSGLEGILERANAGDIVRAQILEITSNELILKLFDGSTINASTTGSTENLGLKRGDFADFRVKDKQDNKVLLETIKSATIKKEEGSEELVRQMKTLGIIPDGENLAISKEIKSNGLPLNKENFEKAVDILGRFKDINPAKAVFLFANKLGAEEKNISALKQLVDEKVKITQSIEGLVKSLEKIEDEIVLKNMVERLTNKNVEENAITDFKPAGKIIYGSKDRDSTHIEIGKHFGEIDKLLDNLIDKSVKTGKGVDAAASDSAVLNKIKTFIENNKFSAGEMSEKFENFLIRNIYEHDKSNLRQKAEILDIINKISNIFKQIDEIKDYSNIENQKSVKHDSTQTQNYENKTIRDIFSKLFVSIDSENLKEEVNVKNIYKELYSNLSIVKDTLELSNIANKTALINNIEQMEDNIRFMNQLNNYSTYIQIPLNIFDRNTTGEFYVLKRDSRKQRINPENTTMFISLNTENMGQVDTFLGLNKKNISINMRVEDNKIVSFIKGYHKELYDRLKEKGYKLVDFKFKISEEDINLTNIAEVAEKEFAQGRVTIDYRL
ncbi:MAG: flagellar hook-length control protein FliK [Clostridia bacterium]|nr:flagellar hook-length control protein FliK [Clostridia bacterium]